MKIIKIYVLITTLLLVVAILGACTPGQDEGAPATKAPTIASPIQTPTQAPIPPSILSLNVDGAELSAEGDVYLLPGEVNPGDRLDLRFIVHDDQNGSLQLLMSEVPYVPSEENIAEVKLSFSVPHDLTSDELPIHLEAEGKSVEYVLRFEPGTKWLPVIEIDGLPDEINMGAHIEFSVLASDLDGSDVLLDIQQVFTRGSEATNPLPTSDYIANFNLEIEVEEKGDREWLLAFDVPLPGHYGIFVSAEDEDGNQTQEYLQLSVEPTVEGILNTEIPFLGMWFKFEPTAAEWRKVEDAIGHDMVIVHSIFSSFCTRECNEYRIIERGIEWMIDANKVPMISFSFEEWDWDAVTFSDKQPSIQQILDGEYDDYLELYAQNLAAFEKPILFIPGWEFNGLDVRRALADDQFGKGRGAHAFGENGDLMWNQVSDLYGQFGDPSIADGPERFIEAWKHIRTLFAKNNADNVVFVWNPSFFSYPHETWNTLYSHWPGEDYVDVIAPSIYNYAGKNRTFRSLFDEEVASFCQELSETPVMIRELGSDRRGNSPFWHSEALAEVVDRYPYIRGVVFFSEDMEGQYAFHDDPTKTNALREELDKGNFGFSE